MKRLVTASGILAVLLTAAVAGSAPKQKKEPGPPAPGSTARGEYLATHVAMCVECHSPRDEKGDIIQERRFMGAPIPFKSPHAGSQWAAAAPSLRSLPGFTDEQIVALLTEGQATGRTAPRRPMPPFRMSVEDARAIVAFLRAQ